MSPAGSAEGSAADKGARADGRVALITGAARGIGLAISQTLERESTHAALTPEMRARSLARLPLGRLAEVSDVADAVLFLCSPPARFITGATLRVDGGFVTT